MVLGRLRSRFETACFAKDGDAIAIEDTFAGKQGTKGMRAEMWDVRASVSRVTAERGVWGLGLKV